MDERRRVHAIAAGSALRRDRSAGPGGGATHGRRVTEPRASGRERRCDAGEARDFFFEEIAHYAYAGDTALHIAAAAHFLPVAEHLIAKGASVEAKNRRGAEPLHYACDGIPGSAAWNPDAQAAVVRLLIDAGADPNARDKSGVAPLHRAVRTRCAAAVRALLEGGADAHLRNKSG
jgi:hypothetical protein